MAEMIAVVGPPGRGKSTSVFPCPELKIQGLDTSSMLIINVSGKPLSMRGAGKIFTDKPITEGGNYKVTHDSMLIAQMLEYVDKERPDIKDVIIEDAQYLMGFAVMEKANQAGWDKWNIIGQIGFKPIEKARDLHRKDLFIWFIYHEEKSDDGERKIKTAGKMIDSTITLEGLFSTILFAKMDHDARTGKSKYYFVTNADGDVKARSRYGTFDSLHIPNDLGLVKEAILKYNTGE